MQMEEEVKLSAAAGGGGGGGAEEEEEEEEGGGGGGDCPRWDVLPLHLWEHILSRLPISTLAIASSVSRTFLSLLRSHSFLSLYRPLPTHPHQDLLLLLFSSTPSSSPSSFAAASYHPFLDRWIALPLPSRLLLASGGAHLLLQLPSSSTLLLTSNALSPTSPPLPLPPMLPLPPSPYAVSLLPRPSGAYAIVAVSTSDSVLSQMYDSVTRRWAPSGKLDLRVSIIGSAAEVGGVLYCLAHGPDMLLRFDPTTGAWGLVEVEVPALACSHVASCGERLWLVGGVEELGDVVGVGVWEMEWGGRGWREVGRMPEGLFRRLAGVGMGGFEVVDRRGVVCFYNTNTARGSLVACDLRAMRWWRPVPCPFKIVRGKEGWLGHAVEPPVELLLPLDQR